MLTVLSFIFEGIFLIDKQNIMSIESQIIHGGFGCYKASLLVRKCVSIGTVFTVFYVGGFVFFHF